MVFLNPLFLWTLLGLSIPIAIHFWSKKKVRTIKIGSTQLLRELHPKQTRSIRLNHWFLLLLRMIIITLIALILAVPSIGFLKTERSITYLVEPSLLGMEHVHSILDTIEDSQLRLLEPGFPLLGDEHVKRDRSFAPDYWQLSQQMATLEADSIIVLTKGLMTGFKGIRPSLDLPVHWLQIDAGEPSFAPVEAALKNDQVLVTSIKSNQNSLTYTNETYALNNNAINVDNEKDSVLIKLDKEAVRLPLTQDKTHRILIVADEQLSAEALYISAAFGALSNYLNQDIELSSVKDIQGIDLSEFDALVWLKQTALVSFPGKTLLWKPDDLAVNLIEQGISQQEFLLRHHLDAENIIELNLPRQLMVLLELHQQLPDDIETLDNRVMDLREIQVNKPGLISKKEPKRLKDISPWLWAFLLLVLPVERILSKYKQQ